MSKPRPQRLLIGFYVCVIVVTSLRATEAQIAGPRKPITAVITRDDLQASIESWAKIESEMLRIAFQKDVAVGVETDGADFLVKQYTERSIQSNLLEDRERSRFVVKMDLFTVLKRSFEENVRSTYKTLFQFLQSGASSITIRVRDIRAALDDEDCSIIPCPPDKCKPDCSPKAFERFEEAPGLYPCAISPR